MRKHSFAALLVLLCFSAAQGQKTIRGRITDAKGLPLAGATVVVKGTTNGATAAIDGSFSITAREDDILEVSFIGYKTAEVPIGNENVVTISLSESVGNLDALVVTGYTTQRVKEITGSVVVVKPEELTAVPAGQVEQMLQGRVAGLNIITSGMPGGGSNVRLRGIGNLGDVTPLYIIDGVQGNINNLNPNDIESLQVLKDAGAYSIYGVRGANGVIVITTKSGKPGKAKVSYDFYMGTTRPLKSPSVLNPQEMANLVWLAKRNSGDIDPSTGNPNDLFYGNGANPVLPDYFIDASSFKGYFENDPAINPDSYNIDFTAGNIKQIIPTNKTGTDWFHEIFKPAFSHDHNITISGANEKNKYLLSFGYLDQEGTLLNTHLKRYTTRINTLFKVTDYIRVGENLQLSYRDNPKIALDKGLHSNDWNNDIFLALTSQPILPVYDIKGGWAHFFPTEFASNPVAQRVAAGDNKSHLWEIFGNAYAEIDLLKYLTLRTSFGGNFTDRYSYDYSLTTYYPTADSLPRNVLNESSGYNRSWTWTNTLRFTNTFAKHHKVNVLIGTEAIDSYARQTGGSSKGFFSNDINYRFLSNGSGSQSTYSFASASTLYSLMGQVDYGLKERYFFKVTIRKDGSSIFGPQNRYGWFPSFSAAWRITEERFLRPSKWLTEVKIRTSWGKTGFYGNTDPNNQYTLYGGSIADAFYDIYGTSNSVVRGFRAIRLGDPSTGWQEDVVTNVGFESVLWKGKLNVIADWYTKKAKGLLFPVRLPDILGGAEPPNVNVGEIRNTGVDILLGSKGKFTKNVSWDATATLTSYNTKIKKLSDLSFYIPEFGGAIGPIVRNEVGRAPGSFYGYKIVGLFNDSADVAKSPLQNSAAPGRFKYQDTNDDGIISDDDRVHFGNPHPNFTLGLNLGINYKNFDFSTFFYGSFGNDVLNLTRKFSDFYSTGSAGGIVSAKNPRVLYDSWSPQNTNTSVPIAENNFNFSNVGTENSYFVEKGTYFRNKSLIVGYTLPNTLTDELKIERCRIYVQALNLFTITNYTGVDPELSGLSDAFGIDLGNYPNNQKQYLFGLSVTF